MTTPPVDATEVDVLLALTNAINRASDIDTIYDAALDALERGVGVGRASILLFDADGVMRFKAWRRLSPEYRRAVEGHTPWTPATRDATPLVVPDVTADAGLAPFLSTIAAEGIAAMTFVPLATDRGVLGKFMLYYDRPQAARPVELKLAAVVAAQVAFAVQRMRAEQAVRQQKADLELVTDAAPVGIAHCDRELRFKFVNGAYSVRFGLRPADIIGKTIPEVLGEAAYASIRPQIEVVLAGHPTEFELTVPYATIGPRIVHVRYAPEFNGAGAVTGWVAAILDVTERRLAEEGRKHTDQYLRTLIEATPECVKVVAMDGTLVEMNSAGVRAVEADSGASVIGRSTYDFVAPEHRESYRAFNERVCGGDSGILEFDIIGLRGTRRSMETHAVPVSTPDGPRMQLAITRDITQRRKSEAALRDSESLFRRLYSDLQRADRQKDEFLAVLAHELRNPLAPIRTALELVRMAGTEGGKRERACDVMDRQLRQLVRLVDDLLDVSRITRGRIELQKEPLELSIAIQHAIETSRPTIEAAGHEFTVTYPREAIYVEGDSTRLSQVFANLLNNAAKYTPRGGHITLDAERRGSTAVVSVRDTGVGIPPNMLGQIFDMFTQVDRSLEKTHGGLGIGLTLVKRLVEMHGGAVEARSEGAGTGSEFVVLLPTYRMAARDPLEGEATRRGWTASTRRILVVDDNEDAAECLAELLRIKGHDVRTAHDGLAAVEAAQVFRPAVVLMDLGMPGLNGYDAAGRIRESLGSSVLLIAVTGWGQEDDRRRSREAGFGHHLIKPVDPDALDALLGQVSPHSV